MTKCHTLVIGYGNCLRRDDGLGPAVAETVKAWQLPGVRSLAVHQLVPEIIDEMRLVDRVLFVDACRETLDQPFRACIIEPRGLHQSLGHHNTPANLLAMLRDLEQHAPEAWMLAISPRSLDHGDGLTDTARDHMQSALQWIRCWLGEPVASCTKSA